MKLAAEVSKSTSPFDFRVTLKLNGDVSWENSKAESSAETEALELGVGKTLVGTW